MSIEMQGSTSMPKDRASADASVFGRFWAWLKAFEEAMETTYDDLQDRRILTLEREVESLKAGLGVRAAAESRLPDGPRGTPGA